MTAPSLRDRLRARLRQDGGVTLIELLVVFTLLVVIGGVVTTSVVQALRVSRTTEARIEALTDLEVAAQRIAREARAASPISVATADSLTVDITRDGQRVRHRFLRTGDRIDHTITQLATGGTRTVVLIDGLTSGSPFTYRYTPGVASPSAADIQEIVLTLRKDLKSGPPLVVETSVSVRNA